VTKFKEVVTKDRVFDDKGQSTYLVAKERHCCAALLRLRKRLLTYRELEKYFLYSVNGTRNGNEVLQWPVMPGCKIS
jgi:hypothetical protein